MFFSQYLSVCLFCALCCFIPVPPLPQTPAVTRPGYKLGPSLAPDRAWCWPSSTHSLAPLRAQAAAFFLWQRQQGKKKGDWLATGHSAGWGQLRLWTPKQKQPYGGSAGARARRRQLENTKGDGEVAPRPPQAKAAPRPFGVAASLQRRVGARGAVHKVQPWKRSPNGVKARVLVNGSRLWTGAFSSDALGLADLCSVHSARRCHKQVAFCRSEWKLEAALEGCRRRHILTLWIFSKTNTKMNAALEVNSNQILECKSQRLWKHTSADHLTNHVAI